MSEENAELEVTIVRIGSPPIVYRTEDWLDINQARREYAKSLSNSNSTIIVADADDAGFNMIAVRNITGIKVREVDPERERVKAEERQTAELRRQGKLRGRQHLTSD